MKAKRPFLLLDRDGTLIVERHYLHDPDGVELLPGAAESIRQARELGWGVAVVTNQAGVGRGYYTEADVHAVHARVERDLMELGVDVDAFFFCPHHPDAQCECRKPARGMGDQVATQLDADLSASVMVGDLHTDLGFGRAIGAATVLVRTGHGAGTSAEMADYVIDSLLELPPILERHDRLIRT